MSDIRRWLTDLGLERFSEAFEREELTPANLPELSDDDLKDLGLPLGPRKTIIKAIEALRTRDTISPPRSPDSDTPKYFAEKIFASMDALEGERRQLTVLFCDMVGFTELANRVDPEILRGIIRCYEDQCAMCITRYEGYVYQRYGDGIVAFFGYPLAHEGEAERAIHAGLEIIAALSKLDVADVGRLAVRIGIATGLVVVSSGEIGAVGETMNLAARLQGIAQPGSIVVSEPVRRLASGSFDYEDMGEQALKGIARPTRAYRVVGTSEASSRFAATNNNRMLLILAFPGSLRHDLLASKQKVEWLMLGEECFTNFSVRFFHVGYGGEIQNLHIFAGALDEAAEQIIDVPTRHDDQHSSIFGKTAAPVVSEPMPHLIAVALALNLSASLDRIIDHTEMQLHAVDRTVDRGVAERARMFGALRSGVNSFFVEGGAMNFIEKSAIATNEYWLRVYRSCPNFAQ